MGKYFDRAMDRYGNIRAVVTPLLDIFVVFSQIIFYQFSG